MAAVAEDNVEQEVQGEDALTCHRARNYVELGFGVKDSFSLAKAQDGKGFFIYWGDIKKLMEKGATHAQIIAIFV